MKKLNIVFFLVCIYPSYGYGQEIPEDYEYLVTLPEPAGLKKNRGIIGEIIADTTNKILVVEYDYKPTYLEIYQIPNWSSSKRVKIKGRVYLDNSYLSKDGKLLFVDVGKPKYFLQIRLETLVQKKIPCNKLPLGCYFDEGVGETRYGGDPFYVMHIQDNYITIYNFSSGDTKIYLKK